MRRTSGIASWTFIGLVLVFLFLPVVTVVLFAFNSVNSTSSFASFSLRWFESLRHNEAFWQAFGNTAKAALLTVVIDELIAIPAAIALASRGVRAKALIASALSVSLVVPGLVLGIALISLVSRMQLTLGLSTVVMGHVIVTFPIVVFVLVARLERLDLSVVSAARDLGASGPTAFRRVMFPLLLPAVVGSAMLAAAWSIDEFLVTLFTNGGAVTLPVYLYGQLAKYGATPSFNAIAACMIVLTVAATLIAGRFVRVTDLR